MIIILNLKFNFLIIKITGNFFIFSPNMSNDQCSLVLTSITFVLFQIVVQCCMLAIDNLHISLNKQYFLYWFL